MCATATEASLPVWHRNAKPMGPDLLGWNNAANTRLITPGRWGLAETWHRKLGWSPQCPTGGWVRNRKSSMYLPLRGQNSSQSNVRTQSGRCWFVRTDWSEILPGIGPAEGLCFLLREAQRLSGPRGWKASGGQLARAISSAGPDRSPLQIRQDAPQEDGGNSS